MDYVVIGKNGGKQLEAYTGFAAVYDIFMDNIPYEESLERTWNRRWDSIGSRLRYRYDDGEAGGLWI